MRCEFGYCIVCDKEIARKCDACNRKQTTDDYTEVMVSWSNGSRMAMACCADCAKGPIWKADKKLMTKAVWAAWDKQGSNYDKGIILVD